MNGEVAMLFTLELLEMAQVRADFFGHGTQYTDMQCAGHGCVNLAQP
jgi:hypothetical protein